MGEQAYGDLVREACEVMATTKDHGDWKATRTANGYPEMAKALLDAGWRPICQESFGPKVCVLYRGHGGGMHCSNSGTMWPQGLK